MKYPLQSTVEPHNNKGSQNIYRILPKEALEQSLSQECGAALNCVCTTMPSALTAHDAHQPAVVTPVVLLYTQALL